MSRVRAALMTSLLAAALFLVASSASAQSTSDTPSLTGRTSSDVMSTSVTTVSADATISTGASNRFETSGYERPMNQRSADWRILPAEERRWLIHLAVASMWRWLGL